MKKTRIDAADVTRTALLGFDGGWYDAYWCSDRPPAKPHLLIRVTRRLGIAIGVTRARHFGLPARRRSAPDLLAASEG